MDAREAFKYGFISRLIAEGYTEPEAMLKAAFDFGGGVRAVTDVARTGLGWAIPAALAAPPIAGYVAGTLAGRATDVDDFDIEEAKRQELLEEYRAQALKARQQGQLHRRERATEQSGRIFL